MNSFKLITETIDPENFEFLVEQKNKDEDPKMYIRGPFIMMNEKNHNNRIYEEDEMEPSVDKYIKEYVNQNRALGEMGHPECYTDAAEVLTESGWKNIAQISEDEKILTLNTSNNNIEVHQIDKKIDQEYKGTMYSIKGKNINSLVTPNHRFPLYHHSKGVELRTIEWIYKNLGKLAKYKIPKLGNWDGNDLDKIKISGVDVSKLGNFKNDVTKDLEIDAKVFTGFMGLWLAEGHLQINEDRNQGGNIVISQRKDHNKQAIRELLNSFPSELVWNETTGANLTTYWMLSDIRLFKYLKPLGNCYNKYIPNELKKLSPPLLPELIDWFNLGDGRNYDNRFNGVKNVFSTSKRLINDLHEILIKSGGSGNVKTIITEADYKFSDHIIKSENKSPLHQLHLSTTNGIYLDKRFIKIEKHDFDGRVYCVRVPNETFYVRENGKAYWTGNSPDVNLERACDNTISLVREGNFYVGKAVCLSTPMGKLQQSLIKDGVKFGKSTRCLGQLQERNGSDYVLGPKIRAIDTVWNPSGQGKDTSCFVDGILENKEFIINSNNKFEELYNNFEKAISNIPSKDIDNYLAEQIISFINSIR